jgi:hypothetical protein
MAFSEALAERIRQALARRKNVEEKKMFGGIGFLRPGGNCAGKTSTVCRYGMSGGNIEGKGRAAPACTIW